MFCITSPRKINLRKDTFARYYDAFTKFLDFQLFHVPNLVTDIVFFAGRGILEIFVVHLSVS